MNQEIEVLAKSIAELKTMVAQNSSPKNMNLTITLYSVGGAIFGGIVTVFMNLFKDKIMFEKNRKKEEQTRKQELIKREEDLIRKLASRLFGLRYSIMYSAKAHNTNNVNAGYYTRLADLEHDRDAKLVLIELMREQNNKAQTGMENFISIIQEVNEIIGEYSFLMPDTEIEKSYKIFINTEFHIKYDFKPFNTQSEIANYRDEILNDYLKTSNLIVKNVMGIVGLIEKESGAKFKSAFEVFEKK